MGFGADLGEGGEGTTNVQDDDHTWMLRHEQLDNFHRPESALSSTDRQLARSQQHYARRDYITFGARVEGELAQGKGSSWSEGE
jgi:hypothetical protein